MKVLDAVRAALGSEPKVDLHSHPIEMTYEDGVLTLEGEVASVAAKKLALERAIDVPSVSGIVDRLRVAPAVVMGDGQLRERVRDALLQEPALSKCALREVTKGEAVILRQPPGQPRGDIEVAVDGGIVTLNGEVSGLDEKRLAGLLAWWVPGSRDVINGLAVEPAEEDSPDQIAEAVRLALEKDPFIDASQVRVGVSQAVVTLTGLLPNDSHRHMAECNAWYVFGVDEVVNKIEVRP